MRYLGGKTRLAKRITQAIFDNTPKRDLYIEPMIGGGSVFTTTASNFKKAIGSDIHQDLMLMYQALQKGWLPPDSLTEEEYQYLKTQDPSPLRAFAGFGCSFGGKWFAGYARGGDKNYAGQSYRNIMKQLPTLTLPTNVFQFRDYTSFTPEEVNGAVMYFDPPYQHTTSYKGTAPFNHTLFFDTCRLYHQQGATVFVSEFNTPEDFTPVLEVQRPVGLGSSKHNTSYTTNTDRLFML